MNNITWINVSEKKVTDEQIEQLEEYFGIKFPNDFIECVKKYDGGYPTRIHSIFLIRMKIHLITF